MTLRPLQTLGDQREQTCAWTPEAVAKRKQRAARRRNTPSDPLVERARLVALWKSCPWHKALNIRWVWWRPFTLQKCYRGLLMPKLRAKLDERDRLRKERHQAEAREHDRKWRQKKAEQAAAKARQAGAQGEMF